MRDCSCRQSHSSAHICARQNIISIWEITWKPFHWFHVFITFCIRYYLGVVAVRTKSTTCQNLPIFPPKLCQRIVSLHLSLMFLFFCSYLRFCCRRCFHACHCHLYNSFFIQHNFSEFFPFFFLLDHKISHISCWKRKIKAHYAESCFQVCDISPIFDVVFTIASQKAAFLIWNILRISRKCFFGFF